MREGGLGHIYHLGFFLQKTILVQQVLPTNQILY